MRRCRKPWESLDLRAEPWENPEPVGEPGVLLRALSLSESQESFPEPGVLRRALRSSENQESFWEPWVLRRPMSPLEKQELSSRASGELWARWRAMNWQESDEISSRLHPHCGLALSASYALQDSKPCHPKLSSCNLGNINVIFMKTRFKNKSMSGTIHNISLIFFFTSERKEDLKNPHLSPQ